jgi:hypothetical protein
LSSLDAEGINPLPACHRILSQAAEIVESHSELGREVAMSMLSQCENALREIIKAEMAFEMITHINEFAAKALPDCDPLQLQAGFEAEVDKKLKAKQVSLHSPGVTAALLRPVLGQIHNNRLNPPAQFSLRTSSKRPTTLVQSSGDKWFKAHLSARKLAELLESIKGGGAKDEDEVVCTQQNRELKCPVLLMALTEMGEMRPVVPTNEGHTPRCVYSFGGITQYCKNKRGAVKCPVCTDAIVSLKELKDCKATARAIRKARMSAADEEPDDMDATQVD